MWGPRAAAPEVTQRWGPSLLLRERLMWYVFQGESLVKCNLAHSYPLHTVSALVSQELEHKVTSSSSGGRLPGWDPASDRLIDYLHGGVSHLTSWPFTALIWKWGPQDHLSPEAGVGIESSIQNSAWHTGLARVALLLLVSPTYQTLRISRGDSWAGQSSTVWGVS